MINCTILSPSPSYSPPLALWEFQVFSCIILRPYKTWWPSLDVPRPCWFSQGPSRKQRQIHFLIDPSQSLDSIQRDEKHGEEPRTPLSLQVLTGISWSQLRGLKRVKPPVESGERTRFCSPCQAGNKSLISWWRGRIVGFLELRCLNGVSEEVRRGAQGDSLQESGKSGLHAHVEGLSTISPWRLLTLEMRRSRKKLNSRTSIT